MRDTKKPFYTADCETDPFKFGRVPSPFIWGLYRRERNGEVFYREFQSGRHFADYIKKQGIIVYFHNGGKFDIHFLADYLNKHEKILMINSRLVRGRIGQAEVRDSYALMPFPLSSYKKDDIDYTKLEANVRHLHMPEIRAYLKADCEYLFDLIEAFFDE